MPLALIVTCARAHTLVPLAMPRDSLDSLIDRVPLDGVGTDEQGQTWLGGIDSAALSRSVDCIGCKLFPSKSAIHSAIPDPDAAPATNLPLSFCCASLCAHVRHQ